MKVLILGANGFIGSHLSETLLSETDWQVFAMDLVDTHLANCLSCPRFHFWQGDILQERDRVMALLHEVDVVLPLVAIATPAVYVQDPLRVFALDFEANLEIVRQCAALGKRVVFPSTSEVYGMCPDAEFDEETSPLVTGPIHRERWIYSASKQMLDRIIYAMGKHQGLSYTLFRPFNWYGPRLDDIHNPRPGGSRVLTQFIGHLLRGEDIMLVDGGLQQRCFMHVHDGCRALLAILRNENEIATGQVFNLGHPGCNISICQLAECLKQEMLRFPAVAEKAAQSRALTVDAGEYYGKGYQDVQRRVPSIRRATEKLGWMPKIGMEEGIRQTLSFYFSVSGSS